MRPHPLLSAALLACALLSSAACSVAPASGTAVSAADASAAFAFGGKPYLHRWSHGGQHEFTPSAQPDLSAWQDMVTVQVYDKVNNPDELALVANGVLVAYQKAGQVLRTSTSQATPERPSEHVVVALLQDKGVREMVFARFRLASDGGGEAIVYSHRVYGAQPDAAADAWLTANGAATEQAMMAWVDIPSVAALRALPQSPS